MEQIQTNVNGMAQRIASLRTRGYVFEKDLEGQAQAFVSSWALLYPNLQAQISTQSSMLVNALRPIEMQMPQLAAMAGNPGAARGLLATLQSAAGQVESKVHCCRRGHRGHVQPVQQPGIRGDPAPG